MTTDIILYRSLPHRTLEDDAVEALSSGLTTLGVAHSVMDLNRYRPSELALICGWKKSVSSGHVRKTSIIDERQRRGERMLILERGFLGDRLKYHALSWDALNGRGSRRSSGMPSDRWSKLGVSMRPWREDGEHVLVCGQVPWDAQVDDIRHVSWIHETVRNLRSLTQRPIVFRLHPKVSRHQVHRRIGDVYRLAAIRPLLSRVSDPNRHNRKTTDAVDSSIARSLQEDLAGCWAVVCHNSNVAVDVLHEGFPVFMGDRCGMAWPVCNHDLQVIESPATPDRDQWAFDLAYDQWSNEELASGEAWKHLTRGTKWELGK